MKSKTNYLIILLLITSSACSIQKRVHQKGYHIQANTKVKAITDHSSLGNKKELQCFASNYEKHKPTSPQSTGSDISILTENSHVSKDSSKCDVIIKRNGDEIYARITEHQSDAIVYSLCLENLSNDYYLRNKDIFMIKYRNGTKKVFKTEADMVYTSPTETSKPKPESTQSNPQARPQADSQQYNVKQVVHPSSVLSFILGILSFFILGIPFGIAAVILGIISLSRITAEPQKYRGTALAVIGIILGLAAVILVSLYLSII